MKHTVLACILVATFAAIASAQWIPYCPYGRHFEVVCRPVYDVYGNVVGERCVSVPVCN
jgi:hypothetical protein